MSDIKLFRIIDSAVTELESQSIQVEKSMQSLIEKNLEALLGVRFLASEFSTGPVHGGRIDTLGLDEDGSPVIIEYKRAVSENVINQGLFYLDWMMDHKKDFQWLVLERLGSEVAKEVEWLAPRLICIAGDFTRYDGHAVKQINRSIELLRYRRFSGDFLMIESVHVPSVSKTSSSSAVAQSSTKSPVGSDVASSNPYATQLIEYRLANCSQEIRDIYESVAAYLVALGDDVQIKTLKYYFAFKRIKNFACVEVFPQAKSITCFLKINPETVAIENGFTRDVRKIGHYGTGDLEVVLRTSDDFLRAQSLFQRAYEGG